MTLPVSVMIKPAPWAWENVPLLPLAQYTAWQDQILARRPEMYRIRRWDDPVMGRSVADIGVSNFQAVGLWNKANNTLGGVTNFLIVPHADIQYLAGLQVEDEYLDKQPDWRKQKMNWLCKEKGTIYFWSASTGDWRSLAYIEWGTIGLGGNLVQVEAIETLQVKLIDGVKRYIPMARLKGFHMTDMGRPLGDLLAEGLVHRCTCAYLPNNKYGDSPKGVVYSPFWSPQDWIFIGPGQIQPNAFYLPMEWLTR